MVCSVCGHRNIDGVKFCEAVANRPESYQRVTYTQPSIGRSHSIDLEIWRRPRRPSARSSRPVKNWARPTTASEQFGLL